MTILLLLALACAPKSAPSAEPSPPGPEASATERATLTLDPSELSWDEATGMVTFSPGSNVQSASYTHYVLDAKSVEAVLGARPSAPVTVVVELGPGETRSYTPEDPNMPQPDGGFQITTYTGRVVARAE